MELCGSKSDGSGSRASQKDLLHIGILIKVRNKEQANAIFGPVARDLLNKKVGQGSGVRRTCSK